MDLSAVARQSVSRRVEASASASASRRTEEEEDDDEDLDADEAKALVRAFVKHALDGVRGGERAQYYELLEALEGLEEPRVSQDKLLMLTVLVECVSSLDENAHEDLLRRVLSVSLWRCADDVAALVVEFCVNLVSTHTGSLLQTCLEMLVAGFVPPPGYDLALLERDGRWGPGAASERGGRNPAAPENVGVSASTPPPRPPEAVTAGVVRAVETILTLVPLAASVLRPILLARLPHASAHKNVQTQYLRAAFRLAETGPGAPLRDALLRGVVSHLLQVDVEITWEHIRDPAGGDGDDSSDEDVEDDMDGDGDEDLGDGDAGGGAGIFELDDIEKTIEIEMTRQAAVWERDARARGGHFARARHGTSPTTSSGLAGDRDSGAAIDETADALDSMMEAALAHVDVRIDRGDGRAVADAVLSIFLGTLLPAHTSKFTQFLVFHVCARDAADRALGASPNAPSALPGLASRRRPAKAAEATSPRARSRPPPRSAQRTGSRAGSRTR
jgi:RNA polymerase I-specific transcription initiation factor RRN3